MLTTVVFDAAGVLVQWDPSLPYEGRLKRDEVEQYFADVDFAALNDRQSEGRTWAEARTAVLARFPHHAEAFDLYVEHFAELLPGPVRDLVEAGVRVLGLTNWSAETFHHAEPAAPAIGLLEDVLVSGAVGLAKPDPRIFALLVERYGLDPAATVYVDDTPVNVEAAAATGFDALLFAEAALLRHELVARGLAIPAVA